MIGLMPGLLALAVELDGPVQVAVVGDGHGVHARALDVLDQLRDAAGAVEQAVVRVAVQVNERRSLAFSMRINVGSDTANRPAECTTGSPTAQRRRFYRPSV